MSEPSEKAPFDSEPTELSKEQATAFLVGKFQERLAEVRAHDPEGRLCYIIPFTYTLEAEETSPEWDIHGGIWVPSVPTQQLVSDVGFYIHWRLDQDVGDEFWKKGIESDGPPYTRCVLDYSGEVPVALIDEHSALVSSHSIKEDVETTYGITIQHM